jgi:Holliday junction resolvase RusA-like endonuclease
LATSNASSYTKVAFPPSIWKAYYRRGTASVKSKAYLDFERACLSDLRKAKLLIPKDQELEISIQLFSRSWYTLPTKKQPSKVKKRDIDNYLKVLIDVLTTYAKTQDPSFDDCRIFSLYVTKRATLDGPADFALISLLPAVSQLVFQPSDLCSAKA